MKNIIRTVIESKRYELADMLKKLDTLWIQGALTEEQHTELVALARQKALPENSYASPDERIDALYKELAEVRKELEVFKRRVKVLESSGSAEDETTEEPTEEIIEEYPEYVQPTGAHDAYHAGDKVTYNGKRYICIAPEGVAVVWNPDVMPSYWQEVTEE